MREIKPGIHRRFIGLFRDTWYLVLVVVGAAVVFGVMIGPGWGAAVVVITMSVFLYFGLVRYDDTGKEHEF